MAYDYTTDPVTGVTEGGTKLYTDANGVSSANPNPNVGQYVGVNPTTGAMMNTDFNNSRFTSAAQTDANGTRYYNSGNGLINANTGGAYVAPTAGQNLTTQLSNAGVATSARSNLANNANSLEAQNAQLQSASDTRLANVKADINSQFDTKIANEKLIGEKTVSGYQAQLGESRGLGFSSSRANFIDQKKDENKKYLDSLEKARQVALNNADIQSSDKLSAQIKDARDYAHTLWQESRQNTQDALAEQRAKIADKRAAAQDANTQRDDSLAMLDRIAKTGGALDEATIAKFDTQFGVKGFSKSYLATAKSVATAKTIDDLNSAKIKILDTMKNIPIGTTIPFTLADGSVFQAQGQLEDKHSPIHQEWVDYLGAGGIDIKGKTDPQLQQEAQRLKLLDFNSYQTADANRKRAVTNISVSQQEKNINDQLTKEMSTTLDKVSGADTYVSPKDWGILRQRFIYEGGTPAVFDASFGQKINPDHAADYYVK